MKPHEITIAVGGGFELDRAALAALIASLPGLRIVPEEHNPPAQVLVWEASAGLEGLSSIRAEPAILVVAANAALESLPETVTGLFARDEPPAALGIAIRQVARGEQYISPSLAIRIIQQRQARSTLTELQESIIASLTEREREILSLLAQGLSNKLIAAQLYLSVRTIEGHLASIYARLGIHSRTEAILLAVKIPNSLGTKVK